ncbi:hypothetical protein PPACK8108_LOCUS6067 [Phakopsora pachyrhizi]|uniref:Uncharacterized protein n=1 Tax=Phakopsora pachyrhizi TaxID=170000 RepID=A0AAV0ARH2_PHAPC|nr:hypothetical protein PPACK8108_LOCUS6067 [Phakopsora pachyrhizi]
MVVIGRMLQNNLLERNCDRDDNSVEKVREEKVPGQYNQLKTFEIQDMVIKFSEVGIEELKTEDGRVALNAARHNGMVHGHLNKLSMTNGEPAKLFGSNSKEIRLDLEQLGFKLDRLESLALADQLESFINSCPSTSRSLIRIFKPELSILPKRMIHLHIDRLRLEFINEINCQRMIEFFLEKGMEHTDLSNPISAGEHLCNIYLVELALSLSMMTLRELEMATEESERLSKSELPRPYLREIKDQLDSRRKGFEGCLSS